MASRLSARNGGALLLAPALLLLGVVLTALAVMLIPVIVLDFWQRPEGYRNSLAAGFVIAGVGITLIISMYHRELRQNLSGRLSYRSVIIAIVTAWLLAPSFAALPLYLTIDITLTDALFESFSGLTTTGATVLTQLDAMPKGVLLWRAQLQWLGGIGIIVLAVIVLPHISHAGMQALRLESFLSTEKAFPRVADVALWLVLIYIAMTVLCALLYKIAGMNSFDAACHAMTTIATGGFSTHDDSFGYFRTLGPLNALAIEAVAIVFMLASAIPFLLYIRLLQGQGFRLFSDDQVTFMLAIWSVMGVALLAWLLHQDSTNLAATSRQVIFNVTSILTGTGYTVSDYSAWGTLPVSLFLVMMVCGGCAGSTSCGLKQFRVRLLLVHAYHSIVQAMHPNRVFAVRINKKPASDKTIRDILNYFILFGLTVLALMVGLSASGLDLITALSGAIAILANVGPGLGDTIGPASNYAQLSDLAKYMMMFGMVLGRLELLAVLILFLPSFWK